MVMEAGGGSVEAGQSGVFDVIAEEPGAKYAVAIPAAPTALAMAFRDDQLVWLDQRRAVWRSRALRGHLQHPGWPRSARSTSRYKSSQCTVTRCESECLRAAVGFGQERARGSRDRA